MDTYKCNYHMHSSYSDGTLSPAQLVNKFVSEEYDIISLTDPETVSGVKEFLAACETAKVRGVSGVEMSTTHSLNGKDYGIVILGYNFDPDDEQLNDTLKKVREKRDVSDERLSSEEAIETISKAGGQAFVAYPAKIREIEGRGTDTFFREFEELLRDLKKKGLKGLECIYPEHSEDEEFRFIQLAGKYHLHVSSGTDYRGEDQK